MMKNTSRGTQQINQKLTATQPAGWTNLGQSSVQNTFPLSQNAYPSMELQVINSQLRAKIENQQNEAEIYHNKMKL